MALGWLVVGCDGGSPAIDGGSDLAGDAAMSAAMDLGPAPTIRVAANDPTNLSKPQPVSFRISELQFLLVRFETQRALPTPLAWARMRLRGPVGTLYDEQHVPFSADTTLTQVASPETNEMVDVRRPKPLTGGVALDFAIAVAGTEIQLRPQGGVWTVAVSIDGAPDLTAEASITLEAQ